MRTSIATDITLILADRVGSLAETLAVLAGAEVSIVGHAGFPAWAGEGVLHLVLDDPDAAFRALRAAGVEVREERQVLVVSVDDEPGSLGAVLERIAARNVNVDLTYALADGRVVIGVNDLQRAQRALAGYSRQRPRTEIAIVSAVSEPISGDHAQGFTAGGDGLERSRSSARTSYSPPDRCR